MGDSVPPLCKHFRGNGIFRAAEHIDLIADIDVFSVINICDVNGCHLHGNIAKRWTKMSQQADMGDKIAVLAVDAVAAAVSVGITNAYPGNYSIFFRCETLHIT